MIPNENKKMKIFFNITVFVKIDLGYSYKVYSCRNKSVYSSAYDVYCSQGLVFV